MAERKMPKVEDFPSNAIGRDREEPIKLRGKVESKRSIRSEFIKDDAPHIGAYLLYDILLPAIRDLISDIGHSTIDMAMGYDDRGSYRRGRSSYSYGRRDDHYVSYSRMYDDRDRRRRDRDDERYYERRRSRDIESIIFEYREDAEDVLDRLCDYLERYGVVPVSYFYDICGETVHGDFTKDDWGWTSLERAQIRRVRKGFIIEFPQIKPI